MHRQKPVLEKPARLLVGGSGHSPSAVINRYVVFILLNLRAVQKFVAHKLHRLSYTGQRNAAFTPLHLRTFKFRSESSSNGGVAAGLNVSSWFSPPFPPLAHVRLRFAWIGVHSRLRVRVSSVPRPSPQFPCLPDCSSSSFPLVLP